MRWVHVGGDESPERRAVVDDAEGAAARLAGQHHGLGHRGGDLQRPPDVRMGLTELRDLQAANQWRPRDTDGRAWKTNYRGGQNLRSSETHLSSMPEKIKMPIGSMGRWIRYRRNNYHALLRPLLVSHTSAHVWNDTQASEEI